MGMEMEEEEREGDTKSFASISASFTPSVSSRV